MQSGREVRGLVADVLHKMRRGEDCAWTWDRKHVLPDGSTLWLVFEPADGVWPAGTGRTRAVLFDSGGERIDESEWYNDPQVRWMAPVPRLRAAVDDWLSGQPINRRY